MNPDHIIKQCQEGDLDAFNELILRHQQYAFAIAIHLLCDEQDARDAMQEAFIRVWEHFDRYDPERKFTTWLYTIVTNVCLDRIRHRTRWQRLFTANVTDGEAEHLPEPLDPGSAHDNMELCGIVRVLTEHLPMKQRLVFVLRDLEDLPVDEVAIICGMSEASVKTNLHLARKRLRELLARKYAIERS